MRDIKWLAVALIIIGAQFMPIPTVAQSAATPPAPSAKFLSQAIGIVDRASGRDGTSGKAVSFTQRLKNAIKKYSGDPNVSSTFETGTGNTPGKYGRGPSSSAPPVGLFGLADHGTFYDKEGRLRQWIKDPKAPGGMRILNSAPMEELRNMTKGLINWGHEKTYLLTSFTDLPFIRSTPVTEQTYLERKNARMRFMPKNNLSLSAPSPVEIGKRFSLRVKYVGPSFVTGTTWWVDGEETGYNRSATGKFSIPLKFVTSGIHQVIVKSVDIYGQPHSRRVEIPVAFTMKVRSKTISKDGGQLALLVTVKGSSGPFKATYLTSDAQKIEAALDGNRRNQSIPDPGQDTIKWVDIVVEDTKNGYVVSRRVKLDDVPVKVNLTAAKTKLKPSEKTSLGVDITGGKPVFGLFLYANGKMMQFQDLDGRKGRFSISFDTPGTYSISVKASSKNISGEKITSRSQPVVLTVSEPEISMAEGDFTGAFEGRQMNIADGAKMQNGQLSFSISGETVTGRVTVQLVFYKTVNDFAGNVTGRYDPSNGKLTAKIKGRWHGKGGGGLIFGSISGAQSAKGFTGRWHDEENSGVWTATPTN